jgi:hypothetical protein
MPTESGDVTIREDELPTLTDDDLKYFRITPSCAGIRTSTIHSAGVDEIETRHPRVLG